MSGGRVLSYPSVVDLKPINSILSAILTSWIESGTLIYVEFHNGSFSTLGPEILPIFGLLFSYKNNSNVQK